MKQVFLGLKCDKLRPFPRAGLFCYNYDLLGHHNEVAMKHFSLTTIARKLVATCQELEREIVYALGATADLNQEQIQQAQDEAALVYLDNLKRIVQGIEEYEITTTTTTDDTIYIQFSGLMDIRLFPTPRHPLIWIEKGSK